MGKVYTSDKKFEEFEDLLIYGAKGRHKVIYAFKNCALPYALHPGCVSIKDRANPTLSRPLKVGSQIRKAQCP
jgi:hypothetical protein